MEQKNQNATVIERADGTTPAERYLRRLCDRSFLSLWSYPGVFRNQGQAGGKGDGKEVCDLLVVFENHIIIFSDKDCAVPDSPNVELDWKRWYKKAIWKSALQVWGAERWIRSFPDRLFLNRQCTTRIPIRVKITPSTRVHRIVVAHDGARRCKEVLGGSGSLMINNSVVGDAHYTTPFTIGIVSHEEGFVHVFDDTTLNIVMAAVDTISDFAAYLEKKERFLDSSLRVAAAGEEELLAQYLKRLNGNGEHDFVVPEGYDTVNYVEGIWNDFARNPQRLAQLDADRVSYAWDALIEKFTFHLLSRTQYFPTTDSIADQEEAFRFLAREPRTRRDLPPGN